MEGCWDVAISDPAFLINVTIVIVICSIENAFDVVEGIADDSMQSSENCESHPGVTSKRPTEGREWRQYQLTIN